MHLEQRVGLVHVGLGRALQLVDLLAHLIDGLVAGNQVDVPVHPGDLHLADFVLVHPQAMGGSRRRVKVRSHVRNDKVLRRDELGHRALQTNVPVNLLEAGA